jgi:transcriptional regulator with XRE-family HTH domain
MEHPGKELKRLRELAGLSQYELSTLCFIPRNRLSLFECGYCEMRDEDYERAERVLQRAIVEKHKNFEAIVSRNTTAPAEA